MTAADGCGDDGGGDDDMRAPQWEGRRVPCGGDLTEWRQPLGKPCNRMTRRTGTGDGRATDGRAAWWCGGGDDMGERCTAAGDSGAACTHRAVTVTLSDVF